MQPRDSSTNSLEAQGRPSPTASGAEAATAPPSVEATPQRWLCPVVSILILLALLIRVPLLVNATLGHDEAEHLHAGWAVAQGQVPYRDFFQSHTPLLYYLIAPVFRVMGEDLRIIYVSRALMLLCILLILLQLYQITRECFDDLTGLLAVLLMCCLLLSWRPAYEFRPDTPQTLLVLASLAQFMRAWRRRSWADFATSGALMGVAFWLLTKTLFPLAGLTLVFVLSTGLRRSLAAVRENLIGLLCFLGAFAALVVLGGILLWVGGAWPAFYRWVIVGSFGWPERLSPSLQLQTNGMIWALALAGVGQSVTRMVKLRIVEEFWLSPLLTGSVTAAVYFFLMPGAYPQSAFPFLPVAALYGASALRSIAALALPPAVSGHATPGGADVPFARSPARRAWGVLTALLIFGVCVLPLRALLADGSLLHDQWADVRQTIRHVLALTSPRDSVFDASGLYIFRPHATYYYRLGRGAIMWIRSGIIPETEIIDDLKRNHCKVVIFSSEDMRRLPPGLLRFLRSNYVHVRQDPRDEAFPILVAGKALQPGDLEGNHITVSLVASGEYEVRATDGVPSVSIDGQAYRAPVFLAQGDHQLVVEGTFTSLAIFYSRPSALPPR